MVASYLPLLMLLGVVRTACKWIPWVEQSTDAILGGVLLFQAGTSFATQVLEARQYAIVGMCLLCGVLYGLIQYQGIQLENKLTVAKTQRLITTPPIVQLQRQTRTVCTLQRLVWLYLLCKWVLNFSDKMVAE